MGPQLFGQEFGADGATCAFGAALVGASVPLKQIEPTIFGGLRPGAVATQSVELPEEWKPFCLSVQACPVSCGERFPDQGIHIVAHLNDKHRWSREQIADWVFAIEATQEELVPPSVPIYEETPEEVVA